ncbi:succinylglutamate desuccinylase/aspartoacylase family protein [Aestuariivirga sp.]|uniref:succinylglutamate desuccinylase/aspartoacylase family protein n=1 Tax=Aestuariivirga sp. TaxID=2650926 RepID=UPI003BAC9E98
MPNENLPFLDRRSFMAAPLAAVAVMADAGQAVAATAGGTVFTGDVVNGKKVVSTLDIGDLARGQKHLLYFQGVESATGQPWLVSVIVAKGSKPGKRITLTSGVHGDEMSSIRVVQMVMDALDPSSMAGSVMAVLDISRPALETMQRRWPNQGRGIDLIDMNREWPGNENGLSAPSRHAGLLFNRLLKPNSDIALDFHTGTTGLECADFIIGDRSIPEVSTLTGLFPVRQVWDSPAYAGVLHEAFTAAGIPSICPEVGAARILDPQLIAPFVEGTMNVLKHYGVIGGAVGRTGVDAGTFIGNSALPVIATTGGFIEHLVKLNDKVQAGQTVIVQRNSFGETVAEYRSPADGEVGAIRSDASSEPGNVLMFILFNRAPAAGDQDYPE